MLMQMQEQERAESAVQLIMEILLSLPWTERAKVFSAVRFNDVFCVECGYGSEKHPNKNCQCTNDK